MTPNACSDDIDINTVDRATLVATWTRIYKRPPPKGTGMRLLLLAAAYHQQAGITGGLSRTARASLKVLATSQKPPSPSRKDTQSPGTRLVREWRGTTHVVDITEDGIVYRGEVFGSLSAVATAITGARWSGPRFFGI